MSLLPPALPSPAPTPTSVPEHDHAPTDQGALRAELETALLRISQDLFEMEICAGDVAPGMEDAVPRYLSRINEGLIHLESISRRMTDTVPLKVVERIDDMLNPHAITKSILNRAAGENQYALGRVLGIESFRRQWHDAVGKEFPGVPLPERRHRPVEDEVKLESDRAGETL